MSMGTPFLAFFLWLCVFVYECVYQYITSVLFLLRATVAHVGLSALQVPLKDKCSRKQGSWYLLVSRIWWTVHGPMAHTAAMGPGWPMLMIMSLTMGCKLLQHTLIPQWWVGFRELELFLLGAYITLIILFCSMISSSKIPTIFLKLKALCSWQSFQIPFHHIKNHINIIGLMWW